MSISCIAVGFVMTMWGIALLNMPQVFFNLIGLALFLVGMIITIFFGVMGLATKPAKKQSANN